MSLMLTQVWSGHKTPFQFFLDREFRRLQDLGEEDRWQAENYLSLVQDYKHANYKLVEDITDTKSQLEMLSMKLSADQLSVPQFDIQSRILEGRIDGILFHHLCTVHQSCKAYLGPEKAEEIMYECIGQTALYVIKEEFPDFHNP